MKAGLRTQIQNDIKLIKPLDSLEKNHIADALAWIDSGLNIFRIEKPDKPPKHLVSYFVLIDPEHKSLLLGHHIKAQLWLPTGGHVELNEHPKNTVIRESEEELRKQAVFLEDNDRPFFITVTQTVGLTAGHTDVSLWYLLKGSTHDTLDFERREFTKVKWFTFDEILGSQSAILDQHMHRFTKKLMQYLD